MNALMSRQIVRGYGNTMNTVGLQTCLSTNSYTGISKLVGLFVFLLMISAISPAAFADKNVVVYGFDGTGKNVAGGAKTNVWYFLKAFENANRGAKTAYMPGVGSIPAPGLIGKIINAPATVTGAGGQARVNDMYDELVKNFKKGRKGIVIVGFSRGAALSREFAHVIAERGDPLKYKKGRKPQGRAPTIQFMGLFDTVYSFGSPAGKKDLTFRKSIPRNVKAVAHATARYELRNTFDLWSIHSNKKYLNKTTGKFKSGKFRAEREFGGGHDDVGGALKNKGFAYKPLMWVIKSGRYAGLKLKNPPKKHFRLKRGQEPDKKGIGKRQIYFPEPPEKEGKPKQVRAKTVGKPIAAACKGKQIYLSGGKCYSCPNGYRRYSPTRKMTHPKACTERGWGRKTTKAKYVCEYNGCKKGQFKHKGSCKVCPSGTTRIHVAGVDTGYCRVK